MSKLTGPGVVILNWNKAICNEGISHYRIYVNEQIVGNTAGDIGNFKVNNMPLHVVLSFKVIAVTNNCRTSKESNTVDIVLPTSNEPHNLNYNLNFYI